MKPTLKLSDAERARVVEVFASVQGEGLYVGEKQIFVRFGGCNLHCDYCDEPETIPIPSGTPWTAERLRGAIKKLAGRSGATVVSWTGGEPLLHPVFLAPMLSWARAQGLRNYLESNGTLPAAMRAVAPLCDVVAMDIKLPSSTGRALWDLHASFLKETPRGTFVKVVLSSRSTPAEWRRVLETMKASPRKLALVLQPATAMHGVKPLSAPRVLQFEKAARRAGHKTLIVPQWQHVWGVR